MPMSRDGRDYNAPGRHVAHVSSDNGIYEWLPILKRDEYITQRFVYIYSIDTDMLDDFELIGDPDPIGDVPDSWILLTRVSKIPAGAIWLEDRVTVSKIPDIPFEDGTYGYEG